MGNYEEEEAEGVEEEVGLLVVALKAKVVLTSKLATRRRPLTKI